MPPLNPFSRSCLALAIGQAMVMPVQAATITVNTTIDVDGGGPCTLREAITSIQSTNLDGTGCSNTGGYFGINDTVDFAPGLSGYTITLTQAAALSITAGLTIDGLGQGLLSIDGDNNGRVFDISGASVNLRNLTISGGTASDGGSAITAGSGGGIRMGYGTIVSLENCTVSGNSASRYGGGISTPDYSDLSLTNSTILDNFAIRSGGGLQIVRGSVRITDSVVSGNSSLLDGGGGIDIYESSATLTNSTVSANSTSGSGGGIKFGGAGSLDLVNSTVSANSAARRGGGIAAAQPADYALNVSLVDSAVSGNSAAEIGGGIYSISSSVSITNSVVSGNSAASTAGGIRADASEVTLQNVTVSNNSAISNGGISAVNSADVSLGNSTVSGNSGGLFNGGIGASSGSSVSLSNSIIAGNRAPNDAEVLNNASTITANIGNLFGDAFHINDAAAFGNFSPGVLDINANSTDGLGIPLASILEPLGDNGGPTQTHALVVDSPAIDAGNNASCLDTDQRGQRRSDGECDIGAYEFIESNIFVVPLPNGGTVIFEL